MFIYIYWIANGLLLNCCWTLVWEFEHDTVRYSMSSTVCTVSTVCTEWAVCTRCEVCTYACTVRMHVCTYVLNSWYLVPGMHPYASVCILMHSYVSVTHPYAPIRLHTRHLRLRTLIFNTRFPQKCEK